MPRTRSSSRNRFRHSRHRPPSWRHRLDPGCRFQGHRGHTLHRENPGLTRRLADGFRAARLFRTFMAGTGKGADFAPYLETLRTQHKAKRNFMQRMEVIAVEMAAKRVTRRPSELREEQWFPSETGRPEP